MSEAMVLNPFGFEFLSEAEAMAIDGGGLLGKILGTVSAAIVGVATIVGGIAMLAVPEPTMLTKVGGVAAIVAGVGTLIGIAAIWT